MIQPHVGNLRQADGSAGGEGDQGVGHVLHGLELGVCGNGQLFRAVLKVSAGVQQVLSGQELRDIGIRQTKARGFCLVDFHGNLTFQAAADGHLGHAVNPLQSGGDHILRRGLQLRQILSRQGDHGGGHQLADIDVDDHGIRGIVRQGDAVELLSELGGGNVQIRSVHIGDLNGADILGRGGFDFVHAGNRHDGGFQRGGYQLFNIGGRCARVGGHHHSHGHFHIGHQRHLQPGAEHDAEDYHHDDRQKGGDFMLNTDLRNFHQALILPGDNPDRISVR